MLTDFLENQRIAKWRFDELKDIDEYTGGNRNILEWFYWLQEIEIIGWRNKATTRKIADVLAKSTNLDPITFYALFCPSYKKGEGAFGFRTDGVGETTKSGVANLVKVYEKTRELGFSCQKPLAIFFDLAVEQAERVKRGVGLGDMKINIDNLRRVLPETIDFTTLSKFDEDLAGRVGIDGVSLDPLPIPDEVFARIVKRGKAFYELFGWSEGEIVERTKVIASSEALVGESLRKKFPMGIMIYTPTMLERSQVYSGMEYQTNPLPIIFPKKGE